MSISTTCWDEHSTKTIFLKSIHSSDEDNSSSDAPVTQWSSLELPVSEPNPKMVLAEQGLFSPGSGEVCAKYIAMSSSSVMNHPYYNYLAIRNPGIKRALLDPIPPVHLPDDDGKQLYQKLCNESDTCPVSLFYKNLSTDTINLSYYGVNSMGIRRMAKALQVNKSVKCWNLTENFLDNDACYHIGEMLACNNTLEELNLTGCRIEEPGLIRLLKDVHSNHNLAALSLSRNVFGDSGGEFLAKKLNHSAIVRLDLSKNELGIKTATALTETNLILAITHLDLSWNEFFHIPTTVNLLKQLAFSQVLEELNLSWNSLEGDKTAKAISFIILIPTLRILDLSNNRLRDKAVQTIVEFLTKAKHLRTLNLSYNPISPEGALIVLKKMLRVRVKIQNLLLEQVCVCNDFLECLERVRRKKCRKNFEIKYGEVVRNWTIQGSDPRELILQRAAHLGNRRKNNVDVPLYLMKLTLEFPDFVDVKELHRRAKHDHVPLNDDLIAEMSEIFPGPKRAKKTILIDLQAVKEFIHRLWPTKTLTEASVMHIPQKRHMVKIIKRVKRKEIKKVKE